MIELIMLVGLLAVFVAVLWVVRLPLMLVVSGTAYGVLGGVAKASAVVAKPFMKDPAFTGQKSSLAELAGLFHLLLLAGVFLVPVALGLIDGFRWMFCL
jgi:hypothetical protein